MMVAMQARTTNRARKPNRLVLFLPLVTAFAIIAGIAIYGVVSPSKAKPNPNAPGFRGSLVWGDGIFANKAQLKAWLKLHGASYQVWVKQHPAALRLVRPPVKHKAAVVHKTRKVAKPKVHKTVTPAVPKTAVPAVPVPSRSSSRGLVIWLAVIAGLILGLVAVLPRRLIHRAGLLRSVGERELRLAALGAGAAVLLGVIAANLM